MDEPDFVAFVIRAEKLGSEVYPLMCDKKVAQALIKANEAIREWTLFQEWVLRNKAK